MRILGIDISKGYIVMYDPRAEEFHLWVESKRVKKFPRYKGGRKKGQPIQTAQVGTRKIPVQAYLYPGKVTLPRYTEAHLQTLERLVKGATIIMEHTGSYSVKYALLFLKLGAEAVFAVHGRKFRAYTRDRNGAKDDFSDAYLLAQYYLEYLKEQEEGYDGPDRKEVYPFIPRMHEYRTLARQYRQIEKMKTQAINRFKQDLIVAYPESPDDTMSARHLYRKIQNGEYDHIPLLRPLIRIIRTLLEEEENLRKQMDAILSEILTPDEKEVLTSFFGNKTEVIFTLKVYYWDISRYRNVDAFIAYMLTGGYNETSGQASNRKPPSYVDFWEEERYSGLNPNLRIVNMRREVRGILYRIWQGNEGNGTKIWKPLIQHVKWLGRTLNWPYNPKVRRRRGEYLTFLDLLLRLLYRALRSRKPLGDVLADQVNRYLREMEKPFIRKGEYEILRHRTETYVSMLSILNLLNSTPDLTPTG